MRPMSVSSEPVAQGDLCLSAVIFALTTYATQDCSCSPSHEAQQQSG